MKQINNTNLRNYIEYLDTISWNFFITGSTSYELTLKSTRRLAERFFHKLPGGTLFFWVAERFEARDGHHIHGLLKYPLKIQYSLFLEDTIDYHKLYKHIGYLWQKSAGNRLKMRKDDSERWELWHQIDLKPYMKGVGAHGYCAKYICKKEADYDLLV